VRTFKGNETVHSLGLVIAHVSTCVIFQTNVISIMPQDRNSAFDGAIQWQAMRMLGMNPNPHEEDHAYVVIDTLTGSNLPT